MNFILFLKPALSPYILRWELCRQRNQPAKKQDNSNAAF